MRLYYFCDLITEEFCNQWFSFPVSNKYIHDVWRMILYIITIPNEATSFDQRSTQLLTHIISPIYILIESFVLSSFGNFKRKNNRTNSNAIFEWSYLWWSKIFSWRSLGLFTPAAYWRKIWTMLVIQKYLQ